jgi:hypothetical protein
MLLVISAAAAFLAREPFMAWWRAWRRGLDAKPSGHVAGLYVLISSATGFFLLRDFPWLALLAAAGAAVFCWSAELAMKGEGRRAAPELLAIGTSMLLAPAAYYVGTGRLDRTALLLWILCFGYFASSVFYVKMRVAAARPRTPDAPSRTRRQCLLYHVGLTALLLALAAFGMPWLVVTGFVPILARGFYYALRPVQTLNLKQIGWTEVMWSLWFLAVLTPALR